MYRMVVNNCGCILAHGMGLGKTIQGLVLCEMFPSWKTICVMPVILLSNWDTEMKKFTWSYEQFMIANRSQAINAVQKWDKRGGVIFVGYELFINLLKSKDMVALNSPDMLLFDEGHRLKNMDGKMFGALNRIKCKRKVILTGYPLQNNLTEYWCMIDFLRPKYLGDLKTFKDVFVAPIENGQCIDSSTRDVQIMKERVYVLHELLRKFVHRQSEKLVKQTLPNLEHNVILIKMTNLQQKFVEKLDTIYGKNALTQYAMTLKIMAHPDLVLNFKLEEDMELDKYEKCPFVFPGDYSEGILQSSPKLELCVGIVSECVKEGDKIIIFSQSLDTLNMIEKFLKAAKDYEWEKNWNYFRIDGLTSQQERCKMLREYDINENIILFLMSTKTCSLGLNLTVANRIIIFDNCWNPCLDMQAISRVHRYGQKKNCVIYRFVTDNCLEKSVYDRQINKQLMFARVVDATCPQPLLSLNENKSVLNVTENKMENFEFTDSYQDRVMQAICRISSNLMSGPPFEHQSFLVERDLNLSIEEKKEAMNSYKLASSMQYISDSDQNENSLPMQVVKRKIVGRNRRKNIDESGKMRMIGTPEPKKRRVFTDNSNRKGENTTESQSNPNEGESSGSVQSMCIESNGANDRVDEGVEIAKSAWVPLEMWQQQGIDAKLVKLDNDVSLKRNGRSITLKQGETTMIIKGKYVQLYNGELIAIK